MQSQNWKLTESVEELSSLQQRVGEERKKVENAEELVRKLEGELSEEKRAKEEEIRQLTESFQEERDVQDELHTVQCMWWDLFGGGGSKTINSRT